MVTVVEYWRRWMERFPTLESLAKASLEQVHEQWAGLGYYRRARLLHQCAREIMEKYQGTIPKTASELEALPGIGRYTAGAIASIVYKQPTPLVDGNVVRVLTRLRAFGVEPKSKVAINWLWGTSASLLDHLRPGDFNEALMELGAICCTQKKPHCESCALQAECLAYLQVHDERDDFKRRPHQANAVSSQREDICKICTEWGPPSDVTIYPIKSIGKRKLRALSTIVCIIKYHNKELDIAEYLLFQRPQNGLLGGFWEFPSLDLSPEEHLKHDLLVYSARKTIMDNFLEKYFGFLPYKDPIVSKTTCPNSAKSTRYDAGSFIHNFTHIKQTLYVEAITCGERTRHWVDKSDRSINQGWFQEARIMTMAISKSTRRSWDIVKEIFSTEYIKKTTKGLYS